MPFLALAETTLIEFKHASPIHTKYGLQSQLFFLNNLYDIILILIMHVD
jgi:hypothetical protein